jgi:uncharacterized protein (DUF2235 family)
MGTNFFFFGISRGAYTARVLAGVLCQIGLLRRGCQNLIPYAIQAYKVSYKEENSTITKRFTDTYCRTVDVHFMGVWDTVTSIGLFNSISLPKTTTNPCINIIRHAVAIDERRAYYRQNLFFQAKTQQDVRQVWFAGVHSDVGGSYQQDESGLSQIALAWMIREAERSGLKVDGKKVDIVVRDKANMGKLGPNVMQKVHPSLSGLWWILEYLPRRKRRTKQVFFPLAKRRVIPNDSWIHSSVFEKQENDKTYNPGNIPTKYRIEN